MDSNGDVARDAREAVWQHGWVTWALDKDYVRTETAALYRAMIDRGETRGKGLSWIKLDGYPAKVAAWVERENANACDVLVSLAELSLRAPNVRPGDAEARRVVRNVRRGYHLAGVPLAARRGRQPIRSARRNQSGADRHLRVAALLDRAPARPEDKTTTAQNHSRHANMATTKRYLRLAGVVFAAEAEALERRLLGGLVPNPGTEEPETALASQTA